LALSLDQDADKSFSRRKHFAVGGMLKMGCVTKFYQLKNGNLL
jgi:hypothetical protein